MIELVLRIIEKLLDIFLRRKVDQDEHADGLDDFAELKKESPSDPTMMIRFRRKK